MGIMGLLLVLEAFGVGFFLVPALSVADENPSQPELPDAFKLFVQFPYAAAVKDVNKDPMFKCVAAKRTEYDSEVPSATYLWSLNAGEDKPRKHVQLLYTSADSPDAFFAAFDSDPSNVKVARFLYTDYATCAVLEMENFGHQCTLWVPFDKRYSYPEECDRKHTELCGEGVPLVDKQLCREIDVY